MAYLYPLLLTLGAGNTGLVASIQYRVRDAAQADVIAATGSGLAELGTSGNYWKTGGISIPDSFTIGYVEVSLDSGSTWTVAATVGPLDMPTPQQQAIADTLLGRTVTAPTAAPTAPYTVMKVLGWLLALAKFKRTQTASTETVYQDDGTTSLATSGKSDSGGVFTRNEYS